MKSLFIQSVIIGLAIAAPVGPIGVLCIRTTVVNGVLAGLAVGLGAALADAVYAIIAGLGLSVITNFLIGMTPILKILGGCFLIYIGMKAFLQKVYFSHMKAAVHRPYGRVFSSTFFLTLSNPMTILAFLGIISALEVEATNNNELIILILGVLIGSTLWWVFLVGVVMVIAKRLNAQILGYINRVSGIVIAGFGVYILFWA